MTTTTSSSNKNPFRKEQFAFLYRFALKKTAGWTAIYTILMFLCYPLVSLTEAMNMAERTSSEYFNPVNYLMNNQVVCAFLVSALMCGMVLVFSAVLNSYMHGKRSADFFHSMPVDREVMLGANFAAGFTALTVPIVVNTAMVSLIYPLILPMYHWGFVLLSLWMQVLAWVLGAFILLAIGMMVAVCVSTSVESVGYTVALLLEGSVLLLIWDLACESSFDTYLSIFSGSGSINNFYEQLLYYLSPVFALGNVTLLLSNDGFKVGTEQTNIVVKDIFAAEAWLPLILWAVIGGLALMLAMKLYKNRQSELAQQWGRQSWLGFSVKLMSAIIGTFLFANIFGSMLDLPENLWYTFGALTGAPLVYITTEAITNKGFTNMKKCLPYLAAAVAINLVGSFYFVADGFRFDERIPEPEQVKTVDLELMFVYDVDSKYSDKYAKEWSREADYGQGVRLADYGFEETMKLKNPETIELITEMHEQSLERKGEYITYANVSYGTGLFDVNRRLNFYANSTDTLLNLVHSDEYLETYNPFFELKGSYLEFVHITDKMGNLVGEGEIPAEAYDRLLDAIREDLKNAEPAVLRDSANNRDLVELRFATKYPKEIYESTGELYHYSMDQEFTVRQKDENTCRVLKELGFELDVPEEFYEKLLSVELIEGYRSGNLPGLAEGKGSVASYEKHVYMEGQRSLTDAEDIRYLTERGTVVYSGYGDQYKMDVFWPSEISSEINSKELYIDRASVAEVMARSENYIVPYILTTEEWEILMGEVMIDDGMYSVAEEYFYWPDVKAVENITSMLDYCKEHHPEILEGKTDAELKCMEKTPLVNNEYGSFYRIHW